MPFRLDLHTHSIVSHDGGITDRQYSRILRKRKLDFLAITDHDSITKNFLADASLSSKLIPAEEITTLEGDVIGLYLQKNIPPGLTLAKTIAAIKEQGGLVYVPHPWEKFRRGLQTAVLYEFRNDLDIIEVFNARSRSRLYAELAHHFAQSNNIAMASSSDAHGARGVGTAYTEIAEAPTRENLLEQLAEATLVCKYSPISAYLYPSFNRVKKYFKPRRRNV
jgi:predicted metal-dependent phosphoesterase TrpH